MIKRRKINIIIVKIIIMVVIIIIVIPDSAFFNHPKFFQLSKPIFYICSEQSSKILDRPKKDESRAEGFGGFQDNLQTKLKWLNYRESKCCALVFSNDVLFSE